MSEKIKQKLKEKIVQPEMEKYTKDQIGTVTASYYQAHEEQNRTEEPEKINVPVADVEFVDERTNTERELKAVPILASPLATNIDGRKIKRGDKVLITFYRNNEKNPLIVGRLFTDDLQMQEERQSEKGVNKANAYGYF